MQRRVIRNNDYNRGYNGYQQPQNPNYVPNNQSNSYGPRYVQVQPRHHWLMDLAGIVAIVLVGWLFFDHFLGTDYSTTSDTPTSGQVTRQVSNTHNNNHNQTINLSQNAHVQQVLKEMQSLDVSEKDQVSAIEFYNKQSPKNQQKIMKSISILNKVIPTDALKRRILHYLLS